MIEAAKPSGGLKAFHRDLKLGVLESKSDLARAAIRDIAHAIVVGPVHHTGGSLASGQVFAYEGTKRLPKSLSEHSLAIALGMVVVPAAIWRELSMVGHWIGESLVLRWAELIHEISQKQISVSQSVDLLMTPLETDRDVGAARAVFESLSDLECVWTAQRLTDRRFDVDHVLPFSVWHSNDLWNLLPTHSKVNSDKRDKIVTANLLRKRREAVIECWEKTHAAYPEQFHNEVSLSLSTSVSPSAAWQHSTWSGLVEAVESTAAVRGLERWEP